MGFETTDVAAHVGQGVNPFNPLQTIQGIATLQNTLNQNRLFQAQRAQGAAVQGAIDPNTGAYDPAAANTAVAGNPFAAPGAQDVVNSNLAYQAHQQELAAKQLDYARSTIGAVASSPNANSDAVASVTDAMVASGVIPKQMGAYIKSSMPTDPKQLGPWLANNFQAPALGAQGELNVTSPAPTPITNGPDINLTRLPQIGTPSVAAQIPVELSPEQKIAGVPVVNAQSGETTRGTVGGLYTPAGDQKPGTTPPVIGLAPARAAALGTAGTATGAQSGAYFAGIQNAAAQAPAQQASLQELGSLLTDPKVQTGPGSPFLSKINGLAQQFGIPVDPKWATNTSKIDVFNKIATQIAQQQFGVIGGTGTDAKLMSAAHTSPDQMISSISNKDIIPLLKGNAAAAQHIAAAANAWQAAGNDATTGPAFQAALVQHHYNPLVFQTAFMDPAERAKIINGLGKADQTKYHADYVYALKRGWITP